MIPVEPVFSVSEDRVRSLQSRFGTPLYAYDQATLERQARKALDFPNPFGLIVRFAMKSCPSAAVIIVQATRPASLRENIRMPTRPLTAAPTPGNKGMSQM